MKVMGMRWWPVPPLLLGASWSTMAAVDGPMVLLGGALCGFALGLVTLRRRRA